MQIQNLHSKMTERILVPQITRETYTINDLSNLASFAEFLSAIKIVEQEIVTFKSFILVSVSFHVDSSYTAESCKLTNENALQ